MQEVQNTIKCPTSRWNCIFDHHNNKNIDWRTPNVDTHAIYKVRITYPINLVCKYCETTTSCMEGVTCPRRLSTRLNRARDEPRNRKLSFIITASSPMRNIKKDHNRKNFYWEKGQPTRKCKLSFVFCSLSKLWKGIHVMGDSELGSKKFEWVFCARLCIRPKVL